MPKNVFFIIVDNAVAPMGNHADIVISLRSNTPTNVHIMGSPHPVDTGYSLFRLLDVSVGASSHSSRSSYFSRAPVFLFHLPRFASSPNIPQCKAPAVALRHVQLRNQAAICKQDPRNVWRSPIMHHHLILPPPPQEPEGPGAPKTPGHWKTMWASDCARLEEAHQRGDAEVLVYGRKYVVDMKVRLVI